MTLKRPMGIHVYNKAARPGSEGGNGSNQQVHINTAGPATQPRCTKMSGWCSGMGQHPMQLRLFALDGALTEPYAPARAKGNNAATSAAAGEVRRAKQ